MDIRQLRTFVHVAELGSFSKAADRLHIAQPALSRQIRLLEAELKTDLLVRHGRGVTLTGAGAVFLDRDGKAPHARERCNVLTCRITSITVHTDSDSLRSPW